jgi:magnesium chelatase family protein
MFSAITSVALVGVEPRPVRVEVHIGTQAPGFTLVGLPDTAVREAKDRVRAALAFSGYRFPNRRVTVNLAPAELSPRVHQDHPLSAWCPSPGISFG